MDGRRVIRMLLVRLIACVILGLVTTFAVSAGLAAFLPHAKLMCLMQADWGGRDFEQSPIFVERFLRHGMERRAWFVHRFGSMHGPSELSYALIGNSEWIQNGPKSLSETDLWGRLGLAILDRAIKPTWGTEDARGWPLLAFWCSIESRRDSGGGTSVTTSGGIALSKTDGSVSLGDFRCIPLRPIWRGVVLNSAF